ncbi:conserved hypothetical protein [Agrobacterium fabacearum S56]|nr:conserved hypothetical protein [Agrobacterium fabacearum S56]
MRRFCAIGLFRKAFSHSLNPRSQTPQSYLAYFFDLRCLTFFSKKVLAKGSDKKIDKNKFYLFI